MSAQVCIAEIKDVTDGNDNTISIEIRERSHNSCLSVRNKVADTALCLSPEGYGDYAGGDGSPILLEMLDGVLRLVVYADINKDEPTHIIDLSGAKAENRKAD